MLRRTRDNSQALPLIGNWKLEAGGPLSIDVMCRAYCICSPQIVGITRGFHHYVSISLRHATHRNSAGAPQAHADLRKNRAPFWLPQAFALYRLFCDVSVERKTFAVRCGALRP